MRVPLPPESPAAEKIADNYSYSREVYESWVQAKRHASLNSAYERPSAVSMDSSRPAGGRCLTLEPAPGSFSPSRAITGYDP